MGKRPLIIVTPLWDEERKSQWMLPGYLNGLRKAGADAIVLDLNGDEEYLERMIGMADGLLITGGQDVTPTLYGEERKPTCGQTCAALDDMEWKLLTLAEERDVATLGICRGLQFMNVFYGGTLYQDIPSEKNGALGHRMTAPYDRVFHEVEIKGGTLLGDALGAGRMGVNSYHHQGVRSVGSGLRVSAVATDGLVEALEREGRKFIVGVQWHPEFAPEDRNEQLIFRRFVEKAGGEGFF